jgi:protein polybromo-1
MFDNACKFNEPDSQIYKDALTLHGLAKQWVSILETIDNILIFL